MRYLILLCLVIPFHLFADSSVWKISKNGSQLFIGGTIHVLGADDYPLPKEFERAYQQAQTLVFETDLVAIAKPAFQKQLMQRLSYPKNHSLEDDLSPQTYQILSDYLQANGSTIKNLNQYRVPMIVISLLMSKLQQLGLAGTGVDNYFNQKAIADRKSLGQLESLQVQLDVIANIGKNYEDDMVLSTIKDMKTLAFTLQTLKKAWRTGDTQQLETVGINDMRQDYPQLYRALLVNRNNAWLPKIEHLLKTKEVEFILVGALHLVGDDSVIASLRKRGYHVELF